MLAVTAKGADSQWFDYKPTYFGEVTRVEWDADTMFAALPAETAGYLLSHGYARRMTEAEIEAYTAPPAPEPVVEPAGTPAAKSKKKGDTS